jgi:hypothetical protein
MRHEASLVAALEGVGRAAFRIAEELAQNSRSGLTVRFLSKKLELPEEEIEYLVDINHRLFFTDLTKVKLVPAGFPAVKRIADGLENHGDVEALFRRARTLDKHDFRHFEEHLGVDEVLGKKQVTELLLDRYYAHPEGIMEYVATRGFSPAAQEVFDTVWQSESGILPASVLRTRLKLPDSEVERAIWELCRSLALMEMFRFDTEDRLTRFVGLLKELRQWRESEASRRAQAVNLAPRKAPAGAIQSFGLEYSTRICRLVAALAAKPARLRGDGELFREDRRRLNDICPEDDDIALGTCLWVAESVGWLVRVEDELRVGDVDAIVAMDRVARHRAVVDWMTAGGQEAAARRALAAALEDLKPGAWYAVGEFIRKALDRRSENEQPVLRPVDGRWQYVSPSAAPNAEKAFARSLEETFLWLGLVERGTAGGEDVFRVTDLGRCLLGGEGCRAVAAKYGEQKSEFIVQPNFDVVVPTQDMDPLLTVPLDQFADRRSTGSVTVYTLSKESFTRGMQNGHEADAFIAFLLAHNRGGTLPANVLTTLEDWRGGVKRVRLRTLHVVESDDPLVMADLMHRRRLGKYVHAIDPRRTAGYAKISKADLAKELEKEGFVVE